MSKNFDEWLKTDAGKKCAEYPIVGGGEYLRNRLWWAFSAGEQSARDKLMLESASKQIPHSAKEHHETAK